MASMSTESTSPPSTPTTPLRIFERDPSLPVGPFYVLQDLDPSESINEDEISALAEIIYNAYLEWKQQ